MYTRFYDMSSGGGDKLGATTIFIEAEIGRAVRLFEEIFKRDPNNVTCHCCGSDYSISESIKEPESGDWIVSKEDIARFETGTLLEFNTL